MALRIVRSSHNPIVFPEMDDRIGGNINGPSLVQVPNWVPNPLGRYYLYFAHHQGKFIRMAYADHVLGPYQVYSPGVLDMANTQFVSHIASPDVHIDPDRQKFYMIYHGARFTGPKPDYVNQLSCYAESDDGLHFVSEHVCLGPSYMRIIKWNGYTYGFAGGGGCYLWRTQNIRELFERGPKLSIDTEVYTVLSDTDKNIDRDVYRMRHPAFHLRGHELDIYYSNVGDCPERIKRTTVNLEADWTAWKGTAPIEILKTETDCEGVNQPIEVSQGGASHEPVHQVRDPYVYVEQGRKYLVYSIAGEKGLGIAELIEN